MTGPWTDSMPKYAKTYRVNLCVWNARWVSMRWKPTVTPNPLITYIRAKTATSDQPSQLPHSTAIGYSRHGEGEEDCSHVHTALESGHDMKATHSPRILLKASVRIQGRNL